MEVVFDSLLSNILKVSVFVLTDHLARSYVFMVGMAHEYNSLTANSVRRLFVHGSLTSPITHFLSDGGRPWPLNQKHRKQHICIRILAMPITVMLQKAISRPFKRL